MGMMPGQAGMMGGMGQPGMMGQMGQQGMTDTVASRKNHSKEKRKKLNQKPGAHHVSKFMDDPDKRNEVQRKLGNLPLKKKLPGHEFLLQRQVPEFPLNFVAFVRIIHELRHMMGAGL